MKRITADMVDWEITVEPEDCEMAAFIRVTGRYKGLEASDCLGGCNYAHEADFRAGGYYDDMRDEVLRKLNMCAAAIVGALAD